MPSQKEAQEFWRKLEDLPGFCPQNFNFCLRIVARASRMELFPEDLFPFLLDQAKSQVSFSVNENSEDGPKKAILFEQDNKDF